MAQRTINGLEYGFKVWSPDKSKTHPKARLYITQHFHGEQRDYGYYSMSDEIYQPKKVFGATRDFTAEVGDDDAAFALLDEIVAAL